MSEEKVLDSTEVSDADVRAVGRAAPVEQDRGAFNPRAATGAKRVRWPALMGLGFVGAVAFALTQTGGHKSPPGQIEAAGDTAAEKAASQAAAAAVTVQEADYRKNQGQQRLQQFDPLGNPIVPEGGQDLSQAPNGQVVPAIGGAAPAGTGQASTQSRVEQARAERKALIERERARQDAMRKAPLMALSNSGGGFAGAGGAGNRGVTPASYSPQSADGAIQRGTPIEQKSVVSDIPLVSAGLLPNRNFLVTAGSLVPCVLQTAMDSTQPGFVSCIVPRDVLSDNGHVVLMEKGTRVLGEFHGGMQQGENRIFVVWNRAITPKGVSIVLGSPAADELGRAGMGGDVSTFFWRRFGGALLLSIVGDATAALSERMSSATMTARAPNQAAAAAVDNDVKIKPRLRAPQGAEMTIFVAKDLDFSNIYSLRLKR